MPFTMAGNFTKYKYKIKTKFKKLNISLNYKAIIVIFTVGLPMVNTYKFCENFCSNHQENLEDNI